MQFSGPSSLLPAWLRNYARPHLADDIVAGLIVAVLLVVVFLAAVFLTGDFDVPLADFVLVAAGFALGAASALGDVLAALGAPACCCAVCAISVMALWAMC